MNLLNSKSSRNLLFSSELGGKKNNDKIMQEIVVDNVDYMFYDLDDGQDENSLDSSIHDNGINTMKMDNINSYHSSLSRKRYNDYHEGNTTGEDTGSDSVGEILSAISNPIQTSNKGILKNQSNNNNNNNNNNDDIDSSNNNNLKTVNNQTSNCENQYEVVEVHENLESRILVRSFTNLGLDNVSKYYNSSGSIDNVQVSVQGYRICQDCFGKQFAQFRLSLSVDYNSDPIIAWRRHSDFDLLACELRETFRNDIHNDDRHDAMSNSMKSSNDFELTLQSWQDILESKPWGRQLSDDYLTNKQNYIEEFLRNLLNDMATADVLVDFMNDDVIESKHAIDCPNIITWIMNFIPNLCEFFV